MNFEHCFIDLKICPFCGGEARYSSGCIASNDNEKYSCSIFCLRCGAKIETKHDFDSSYEAHIEVSKQWNRRVT